MQCIKTIKVKIHRPTNVKRQFLALIQENARLLNQYIRIIQKHNTTSKTELHKLSYKKLRKESSLPSALIQTSRDKAIEAYKSYKRTKGNRKVSLPIFNSSAPVRLDKRTLSIIETNNKHKYFAAITTNGKRVHVPLLGHRYQYKYLRKLLANELEQGTAELIKKKENFYLYITVKKDIEVKTPDASFTPIGVDLGLANLSVSVILKDKPASALFHKGNQAISKRNYFSGMRKSLGKAKKLWKIKATSEKEAIYMRDRNHKISDSIIRQVRTVENPVIVMEDLKHIRQGMNCSKKMNKHLHSWSFRQLQGFIEYKANWHGIPVAYVSPKYTSQECSKCGHTEKANRNARTFKCMHCGYELNADLNAAVNIAQRYKHLASGYMSDAKGCVAEPLTLKVAKATYQGSPHR